LPAAGGDTQSFRIAAAAEPFPVGTGETDPLGETDPERRPITPGAAELVHAIATNDKAMAMAIAIAVRIASSEFIVVVAATH
jgi:hypothetical protein